ncbi:MAG: MCP four helix bundle domain-containing protein [Deltaproteobacteria bacterium]|nr:MCP four helix bundle domain-containing protein [Deltaproteobacteria bacterium]
MSRQFSLRARIFCLLGVLILAILTGPLVTIWYTYRTQDLYSSIVDRDVTALIAAGELKSTLAVQKGLVSYYFLDNDEAWIRHLDVRHNEFIEWIKKARWFNYPDEARETLTNIESCYLQYTAARNQVIQLYREGNRQAGAERHRKLRDQFYIVYRLCEKYKDIYEQDIARTREDNIRATRLITTIAWSVIPCGVIITLLLGYVLFKQILDPIRELAIDAEHTQPRYRIDDEVKALSRKIYNLIEDVGQAQSQLEESREHLIQSEKMALVGKLAAGVAHSIRNPLTSVKMRLFSLERSLSLNRTQKEDLEVISEEIRHIDTIVGTFLEFSRPPKLKFQLISPSDVVDNALHLLKYRLESYGVKVWVVREERLPGVMADPEQLKEVLVNLLLNACDAMGDGGAIQISEEMGRTKTLGEAVIVRVRDDGPGIPESVLDKIFQPFFSTKDEGSGLGLSIAKRIIEEHGGRIQVQSGEDQGTTFTIALPFKENAS